MNLNDFLEVDEELRKEMTRGQKEPQEECYSAQDTDPVSTRNWVHKTTSSKPKEERLDWWDELVEGGRDNIDERVDEAGNQPIPQLGKPEPKKVKQTDDDLPAIKAETTLNEKLLLVQPEEQGNVPVEGEREIFNNRAMALWLYNAEDDENRENGEENKANRALVTMKNAVEDLEPPHTSSNQSRGEGGGEGVSWVNPRKHPTITMNEAKGRRKVNPEPAEQRKVNPPHCINADGP